MDSGPDNSRFFYTTCPMVDDLEGNGNDIGLWLVSIHACLL